MASHGGAGSRPPRSLLIPLGSPAQPSAGGPTALELEASLALADRTLAAEDTAQAAAALLESVVSTYGFSRGAVLLGQQRLSVLAAHALADPPPRSGTSQQVERAQESLTPQIIHRLDADAEPWLATWLPVATDVLVVALHVEGLRLGALLVQLPVTLRGQRAVDVTARVEVACHTASLGLHRLQRIEQLQRLAATDDLTKIANRRGFDASLERELARSERSAEPVSLVILDIDHFKRVNDVHGHTAGDEALRNVAAALSIACRGFDIPARHGGEEFAVILPDCDVDKSVAIANRLREAVAAAPAVELLTASAGVATFPAHAADSAELFAAADEALLLAKRSGRDRTVLAVRRQPDAVTLPASRARPSQPET